MTSFTPEEVRATLAEVAIPAQLVGRPPERLVGFSALHDVRPATLSWSRHADPGWARLAPCLLIGPPDLADPPERSGALRVADPRYAFVVAAVRFGPPPPAPGVAPSAIVGDGCVLGDGVTIGAGAVLGPGVTVGDGTRIDARVVLEAGTRIGARCHIQPGAVLGAAGFGYVRDPDGSHRRFPHTGGVVLEDDVHIGANTCIDRGALQDTVIRAGTLIDNLCHVGHNCDVGPRAVLIAGAVLGGSTRVGEEAYIGPNVVVSDQLAVGRGAMVGLGAVVMRDVAAGTVVQARAAAALPPAAGPGEASLRYRP